MIRQFIIIIITLAVLAGSLVTASATIRNRDETLRGYVDPTQDANLPYRIPRFGVNAELTQYTPDELAHQLDLMRQAHVTWVRQPFRWSEIEPQPGEFQWDNIDTIVQHFAAEDAIKLVAVLLDSPAWARTTPALQVLQLICLTMRISLPPSLNATVQPSTITRSGTSRISPLAGAIRIRAPPTIWHSCKRGIAPFTAQIHVLLSSPQV